MKISVTNIIEAAEFNTRVHTLLEICIPKIEAQLKEACLHNAELFHSTDMNVPCLNYENGLITLSLGGLEYTVRVSSLPISPSEISQNANEELIQNALMALLFNKLKYFFLCGKK